MRKVLEKRAITATIKKGQTILFHDVIPPGEKRALPPSDPSRLGRAEVKTETHFLVRENAHLKYILAIFGGQVVERDITVELQRPGAEAEIICLFFGKADQRLAIRTNTIHTAPNTSARVWVYGAVKDAASANVDGLIRVLPKAQKTDSYFTAHALLLSPEARANTKPQLEIEADDVRASHGATVSKIDEEQLFYLQSKGLNRKDAEQTILEGFFVQAIAHMADGGIEKLLGGVLKRGLH